MRQECRERFSRHRLQRKPLVSDPGMHHGTCVMHVPWCMSDRKPAVARKTFPTLLVGESLVGGTPLMDALNQSNALLESLRNQLKVKDREVSDLRNEVDTLKVMYDDLEQYGRRGSMRVFGVPEHTTGTVDDKVLSLINKHLQVTPPLALADIEVAHRLGKPPPKPFICDPAPCDKQMVRHRTKLVQGQSVTSCTMHVTEQHSVPLHRDAAGHHVFFISVFTHTFHNTVSFNCVRAYSYHSQIPQIRGTVHPDGRAVAVFLKATKYLELLLESNIKYLLVRVAFQEIVKAAISQKHACSVTHAFELFRSIGGF